MGQGEKKKKKSTNKDESTEVKQTVLTDRGR